MLRIIEKLRWMKWDRRLALPLIVLSCIVVLLGVQKIPNSEDISSWTVGAEVAVSIEAQDHPHVDGERQWATLTTIARPRYQNVDRTEIRAYLVNVLESFGWAVHQQIFSKTVNGQTYTGINIIAEPGVFCNTDGTQLSTDATTPPPPLDSETDCLQSYTPSDQATLIVGTHYDTVSGSPGADDNGTGISALLELAALFSPKAYPIPLKLVFFDLEEFGLWGSEAFVADAAEIKGVAGAIILEMLGYRCQINGCQQYPPLPIAPPSPIGDFLAVVGDRTHPELIMAFQTITSPIPFYTLAVPTVAGITPDLLRSDHVSFWQKGIGAVMVTDTANFRNPHYHQVSDRPDTLDPEFLTGATQVIVDAVIQLAHSLK